MEIVPIPPLCKFKSKLFRSHTQMAIFTGAVYLLVLLVSMSRVAECQNIFDANRTMDLCFSSRRNQTGHFISKWSMNNGASKLPTNLKINMRSNVKEEGGMQYYQLHVEIAVPPPRPPSYELFPGVGYYKFYPDGSPTFYQASSTCMNEGGHLAIVNSEAEMEVIKMLYARYPKAKEWAYVGFNDLAVDGKYITIFGQPLENTGYLQWAPGQPDNGEGNEDCGSVHRTGKLNDLWCDKNGPWPFICEYDLSWDS